MLVLALMALLMAAVAPQLRGFGRGQKLQNAADEFLAATRYARSEAIATAVPHRVEVSSDGSAFWVSRLDSTDYAAVAGDFGRGDPLPTQIRVTIERADEAVTSTIDFFPNGTTSPATVVIESADTGRIVTLRAVAIADPFRRESAEEAP